MHKVNQHVNNKYLCCNCNFFSWMLLPCCHILILCIELEISLMQRAISEGISLHLSLLKKYYFCGRNKIFKWCKICYTSDADYNRLLEILPSRSEVQIPITDDENSNNMHISVGIPQEIYSFPPFGHFQTQTKGTKMCLRCCWEAYNGSVEIISGASQSTCNIVSFPEVN